ncbi:MAG: DUF445 domain-containing protein [Desulfitobacterium sp.]|nr:DUF445 domain-containing protein [Desulfitobacterium sp.]
MNYTSDYRKKANIVLAAVFLFFLCTTGLRILYPTHQGIYFLFFVSEAALVGGIADWFAVTALFRKPLGWPYHTEIIPRNREKMIEGVVSIVEKELLSPQLLRSKITTFSLASWLIKKGEEKGGSQYLTKKALAFLMNQDQNTNPQVLSSKLEKILRTKFSEKGLACFLLRQGREFLTHEKIDEQLDLLVGKALNYIAQPEAKLILIQILEQIQEQKVANSGKLQKTVLGIFQATEGINLDEAAESLQMELINHFEKLQMAYHPVRGQLKEHLTAQMEVWENDPETLDSLETWKNKYFIDLELDSLILTLLEEVIKNLEKGKLPSGQELGPAIYPVVDQIWSKFKEDPELQKTLDTLFQEVLLSIVQREHKIIGQITRETLENLSNDELNQFIEEKAGNDLQWIRINGSLIGGIVGAILFVFLNYGYAPLLDLLKLGQW